MLILGNCKKREDCNKGFFSTAGQILVCFLASLCHVSSKRAMHERRRDKESLIFLGFCIFAQNLNPE